MCAACAKALRVEERGSRSEWVPDYRRRNISRLYEAAASVKQMETAAKTPNAVGMTF